MDMLVSHGSPHDLHVDHIWHRITGYPARPGLRLVMWVRGSDILKVKVQKGFAKRR
jgi:hypothetical protein